jgi:hypothetical protein
MDATAFGKHNVREILPSRKLKMRLRCPQTSSATGTRRASTRRLGT